MLLLQLQKENVLYKPITRLKWYDDVENRKAKTEKTTTTTDKKAKFVRKFSLKSQ